MKWTPEPEHQYEGRVYTEEPTVPTGKDSPCPPSSGTLSPKERGLLGACDGLVAGQPVPSPSEYLDEHLGIGLPLSTIHLRGTFSLGTPTLRPVGT